MSDYSERADDSAQDGAGVSRRKFLERTATAGSASILAAVTAGQALAQGDQKKDASSQKDTTMTAKPAPMGEMMEYQSNGMKIPAYFARPKQKGKSPKEKAPAILVIHEVFGLNDHIKSIADRLAAEGYNALAPNFFVRAADPPKDASDVAALRKAASSIPNEVAIGDMQAGLNFLKTVKDVRPRFASIGFCMGGGFSYQIATHTTDLAGAVIFYGRTPIELVPQVSCPLLASFGGLDQGIPPEKVKEFEDALKKAGKQADIKIYADAKHGFFNDSRPEAYNPVAAADAWQRTLKFFNERLRA
jgi:carboxymethylenebutenolidase